MSRETSLVVTLTAAFGIAGAWNANLPPIYDVRQMGEDGDFRATQLGLLTFAAILGVILAMAANSSLPLIGVLGMALAQAAMYEWAIRAD